MLRLKELVSTIKMEQALAGGPPVHVVGESRIREVHAMCPGCGRRPVERPGERCAECAPEEAR